MKFFKLFVSTFILIALFAASLFVLLQSGNGQTTRNENSDQLKRDSADDYLLLHMAPNRAVSTNDETRRARGAKFDKWSWLRENVDSGSREVSMASDWQFSVPAMPVAESDDIVVGKVLSGKAFFSNDGSNVYSEFTIEVSECIKQSDPALRNDMVIDLQRVGGRILYPAGNVVKYHISGQEMPQLDGRYVFFLSKAGQSDAYKILTAYQLIDGKVVALDGRGRSKNSGFEFTKYDGTAEDSFLNQIRLEAQSVHGTKSEDSKR